MHLPAKRATSKGEAGRGRGRTCALIDVGAGHPIAGVARVARACEGADGVGARRVGVALVGPVCDRGAGTVSSSVAPCNLVTAISLPRVVKGLLEPFVRVLT